jgi:superfamily II DNA or RNA helicase
MSKTDIAPYRQLDLKIYGYYLPQLATHQGSVKVGETNHQDVKKRIQQQTGTVGITPSLLFVRNAVRNDGQLFHDRDLHAYYRLRGIKRTILNGQATEWYYFGDVTLAESMTDDYISLDYDAVQVSDKETDYILRDEQAEAVDATYEYWQNPIYGTEFLWNAKPRFGKTLTTYDFARRIKAKNVLIVTNRPAIANSWYDDFEKFIAWQEPGMKFVSETSALEDRSPMSHQDYLAYVYSHINDGTNLCSVNFISLQDLKGAKFADGLYDKLEWVKGMDWDLLVIDEAHEGIDTLKTDRAFENINRNFTLHLSGTPFKALANQKFHSEQIFNWSYLDEQTAKREWDLNGTDTNPYAALPTLSLFTYQMSKMIEEEVARGIEIEEDKDVDYAFDLNEFFSTKDDGTFTYEKDVIRFLDNLCSGKFPFAENEHKQELKHTFWLLPRVASCKAMEQLLKAHPFFKDYEIILAAGDGISLQDDEDIEELEQSATNAKRNTRSYDRLKEALAKFDKTITLSVSQLTTGVTIPEWTAVLMLSNIKSPALYFQAAFRAQNPYEFKNPETGEWYRKENSYVFDFAPDRTLILFDEFANNLSDEGLSSTVEERQENIRELINFFPVIAEDEDGYMTELSPEDVLTFPSRIKAQEVVKRGFMSNLLFANISAIFSAPAELKAILDKISIEKNKRLGEKREIKVTDPMLNDKGEVEVDPEITISTTNGLFGEPIYKQDVVAALEKVADITNRVEAAKKVAREMVGKLQDGIENTRGEFGLTKKVTQQNTKKTEQVLISKIEENMYQRDQKEQIARAEYEAEISKVKTIHEKAAAEEQYQVKKQEIQTEFVADVEKTIEAVTQELVETHLVKREENKKKTTEDDVRDHLRGFARTIPAFLMAYGSTETTLANFDQKIDPDTFLELTSITLDEFRKLRDGFDYPDEKGKIQSFPGLFNEVVFNASVTEFFRIKDKLADYLHTDDEEDIFGYIPPQKTNQIFTPKRVVKMMVDMLEQHDTQIFKSKETTFIDLYAKSGLYLTEVVKRLFRGLEEEIPDEEERIKWILENQVYGCAPSNIIYNMVRNYVYGGYPQVSNTNLLELDLTEAAKKGLLELELHERLDEKVKFDVIIGNPPYQLSDGGQAASAIPLYNLFVNEAKNLHPRYLSMIIPARWYAGGKGLSDFRKDTLSDRRISFLVDYANSVDLFPDVNIAGGVCYFLWENEKKDGDCRVINANKNGQYSEANRPLGEYEIFVRDNASVEIIRKIKKIDKVFLSESVKSYSYFAVRSYERGKKNQTSGSDVVLLSSNGKGFYDRNKITDREDILEKYKVIITYAMSGGNKPTSDGNYQIVSSLQVLLPNEVCTETYLVLGTFDDLATALNMSTYISTKFCRFLMLQALTSIHITKDSFQFVPAQDFSEPWTDEELYKKYQFTIEEIKFIESTIRPMD